METRLSDLELDIIKKIFKDLISQKAYPTDIIKGLTEFQAFVQIEKVLSEADEVIIKQEVKL